MQEEVEKLFIKNIFKSHWEYYSKKEATDISQITGLTKHISDEYQGRVIYELMQNAFDPADEIVTVEIKTIKEKDYLVVCNDGIKFGFEEIDYSKQLKPNPNDNFHALCSIATSSKTVEKNIGNKGVGFKSVFSLSNAVYVVSKQDNNETITFKLFGKIEKCEFEEVAKNIDVDLSIQEQLFENKETLIPGFYYPLLQDDNYFNELVDDKIETAIVIPLDDCQKLQVQDLIRDIKDFHFEFIKQKYKEKELQVYIDQEQFTQETIEIFTEDTFAILWKKDTESFLYNFMPSLVESPFQCMDINGEFQTSVNREYINFDTNSEIGDKNLTILKNAIGLHFEKISDLIIDETNKDIFWKLLLINNNKMKAIVENVVKDRFVNWDGFGDFISELARNYFSRDDLTIQNFDDFWKVIHLYTGISSSNKSYTKTYKYELKKLFLDRLFQCEALVIPIGLNYNSETIASYIPEIKKSLKDKIFYKDDKNNEDLSESLDIYLTNYTFSELNKDVLLDIATKCTIKKFVDYNEILKHFRQVSRGGEYSDRNKCFSEEQQKDILKSLFQIYLAKNESDFESTHRYKEILSNKLDYTKTAAETAIATIFLTVGEQKYKPAQFCHKTEIYTDFVDFEIPEDKKTNKSIDDFLKYLGVSFDENIRYTDLENKVLFDGLDYIPSLYQKEDSEKQESIKYISKMRIYYKYNDKFECKHPALLHKTPTYNKILTEIKSDNKEALSVLIKRLVYYPKAYMLKVVERLQEPIEFDKNIVFKIYLEIFKQYKKPFLIYRASDGSFEWIDELKEGKHYIAKTKEDFELLKGKVNLLATFKDVSEDDRFKVFQEKIEFKIDIDEHIKGDDIKDKIGSVFMPYILLAITDSDLSEHNFLEDEITELFKFNKRWLDLKFLEVEELKPRIIFDANEFEIEEIQKPIRIKDTIFYKEEHKDRPNDFTDVLVDFFNIEKLKAEIKLILMGEVSDYEKSNLEKIRLKWIKIDDKVKDEIIRKLIVIGFKEDITFNLNYTQDDFKVDDHKDETQENVQNLINEIQELKDIKSLTINFNCECENRKLIKQIEQKYKLIEIQFEEYDLVNKVYLTEDDLYQSLNPSQTKEELDVELRERKKENLKKDWKLEWQPVVQNIEDLHEKNNKADRRSNVDNFSNNSHSNRAIKIAQNRGLKIEEELIDILAVSSEQFLGTIIDEAKDIFKKLQDEIISDTQDKRFRLKNRKRYEEILDEKNLKDILHVSKSLGDGLGFDIFYPSRENGTLKLLKVEVKSSSDGKTIYLSENERKQILLYEKDESFRIYLYVHKKTPLDITKLVFKILKDNIKFKNITAETWILNIMTKEH